MRRKNPVIEDIVKTTVVNKLIDKVTGKVAKVYSKSGRRKNSSDVMIPADEVAILEGGEFIPLKGMIVTDDAIQLVTEPNTKADSELVINNPSYLKRVLAQRVARSGRKGTSGRSSINNPTKRKTALITNMTKAEASKYKKKLLNAGRYVNLSITKGSNGKYTISGNKKA